MASDSDVAEARRVAREVRDLKQRATNKPFVNMTKEDNAAVDTADLLAGKINDKFGKDVYSSVDKAPAMTYYNLAEPSDPKKYGR